MIVLLNNYIIV